MAARFATLPSLSPRSDLCKPPDEISRNAYLFKAILAKDAELPELLERALAEKGWEEHDPKKHHPDDWNLLWQGRRFSISQHLSCRCWQRLNHFPGGLEITHKDGLVRAMRRLQSKDPSRSRMSYFIPESLVLPREYTKLVELIHHRRLAAKELGDDVWIYKPANQSRGRGITLFREAGCWSNPGVAVVQHYIKPLLIGGFKFDLRLYVAVVSFKPLVAYIFQDCLVRFATERYNLNDLDNVYSHLTNTSINTQGPGYRESKGKIGTGCKWNMRQLGIRFYQEGIDDRLLWQQVTNIIILTLLTQDGSDKVHQPRCVELFGFDVMIDRDYRPWLLEVNESPSLGNDCSVDEDIKIPMLQDFLDLMDLKDTDRIPKTQPRTQAPHKTSIRTLTSPTIAAHRPVARTSLREVQLPSTLRTRRLSLPPPTLSPTTRPFRTPLSSRLPAPIPKVQRPSTSSALSRTAPRLSLVSSDRPRSRQVSSPPVRELPELQVGGFVLIFPFNRQTQRDESICRVMAELNRKEEEMRLLFASEPFDWRKQTPSYPFAMHQEAQWPEPWPSAKDIF